jgi:hypothetical protein
MRYALAVAAGFALMAALWAGAVALQQGVPTESSRWAFEMLQHKAARAAAIQGPGRLVLVGGSSTLFGLRAETIARETGMPTVNLGMTAVIGFDNIIDKARALIRPGDTVLLTPEYVFFAEKDYLRASFVDYVLAREPGYLDRLPLAERARLVFSVPPRRLLQGLRARLFPERRVAQFYEARTLGDHGDETGNRADARSPQAQRFLIGLKPEPHAGRRVEATYRAVAGFVAWAKTNGVRVILSYPNFLDFEAYRQAPERAFFAGLDAFYRSLGVPVIGAPDDFMFPAALFYDHEYHLNDRGAAVATAKMLALLRPYLPARPAAATGERGIAETVR